MMPALESNVPTMIDGNGEIVRVLTAHDLLRAAGVDLEAADLGALARYDHDAGELAGMIREARGLISDELVRRLDRRGSWTVRENGLEVKSSSPEAGTVQYDTNRLRKALGGLVADEVIDPEAATNALELVVPPIPSAYWKQKPAGIKALQKLGPAVQAALDGCREDVTPPRRVARVRRVQP